MSLMPGVWATADGAAILGGSSDGGVYSTVYEVDFSALTTQDLKTGGDGDKTVDSHTWVAQNAASATTLAITNGVGLDFLSSTNAEIYLRIDVRDNLAASFCVNRPWRVWTRYTFTADADFENANFVMENDPTAPTAGRALGCVRGRLVDRYAVFSGSSSTEIVTPGGYTGHNLLVVEYQHGVLRLLTGLAAGGTGVLPANTDDLIAITSMLVDDDFTADPFVDGDVFWRLGINNSLVSNRQIVEAMRLEVG